MESQIGSSFKKVKALCYKEHKDGFYVYAKPNHCDPKAVANYIGRYLGRPVIATSRIDKYDGGFVTFHYNRHEDDKYVVETIPVLEFISRLIQHIPEKHFKIIRYGGLYARTVKLIILFFELFPKRNVMFSAVLINGGLPSFLLSAMILLSALIVDIACIF